MATISTQRDVVETRVAPLSSIDVGRLLVAVLALCIVRLWLMPLPTSFWADEIATAFVVRFGEAHSSLRIAPQVSTSLYYLLPALADRFFGMNEIAYRIPSLLSIAGALFFISRIAARLIHPDAGWFAAFACLLLRGFNYQAADARPYALGTLVLSATLWFLIRWLDTGRARDAVLFIVLGALLWRIHLIFWPLYLLLGGYCLVRLIAGETRVSWFRAALVFGGLGLGLYPVLENALPLLRHASAHVVAPIPTGTELVYALKPGLMTAAIIGSWLVARLLGWRLGARHWSWSALFLILGWWLCQPLVIYLFSLTTGNSLFVPRYLYVALPGAALTATILVSLFAGNRHWRPLAVLLGISAFILSGHWDSFWPTHHNSDWRGAAAELNRISGGSSTPVICPSPFIEARVPAWQPAYPLDTFLYSHLACYRINAHAYPFPFSTSPEAEAFAASLADRELSAVPRFYIYGALGQVSFWQDWFSRRLEGRMWKSRTVGRFGDVEIVAFEHQTPVHFAPQSVVLPEPAASGL